MEKKSARTVWVDLLRVIAICFMMLYHLCGKGMWWATTEQYYTSLFSAEYRTLIFFHMISRVCIPVLLMISGMFLLDPEKELPVKKLYGHNVLRILLSLLFWNMLYAVYYAYQSTQPGEDALAVFSNHFLETHYHLEFLYALIGVYVMTPVLRIFVKWADQQGWKYLLVLFLICISIIPSLQMINFPICQNILNYILRFSPRYISASSGIGYAGFYMLGYYLKRYGIPERLLKILTGLVVILGLIEVVGKPYFPEQIAGLGYYDMGTILGSVIFVCWMKHMLQEHSFGQKTEKIIILLSKWSFGAYLIHDFVLQFFVNDKSYILITHPFMGLAADEIIVVAVSFAVSALLNQVPVVRKYLI